VLSEGWWQEQRFYPGTLPRSMQQILINPVVAAVYAIGIATRDPGEKVIDFGDAELVVFA
jgi:hypothetical protein